MRLFTKLLGAGAVAASCALFSIPSAAAEIQVGGVVWDPNWTAGTEQDFSAKFNFTQWYSTSSATPAGTAPDFATAVSINTVLGALDGSSAATGYFLQGVGEFYNVNNPTKDVITNNNSGGGANSFVPNKEMTFAFGGIALNKDSTFNITNAWARMYVGVPDFNPPPVGQPDVAKAMDGLTWLDLQISSFKLDAGTVQNGLVSAVLSIVGGVAMPNFLPLSLDYSGSAFFFNNASYSSLGNGQLIGDSRSVPEPGALGLMALGLLAAGVGARRRRKS